MHRYLEPFTLSNTPSSLCSDKVQNLRSVTDTLTVPASKIKTQGACNTPITLILANRPQAIAYFTLYLYLCTCYIGAKPQAAKIDYRASEIIIAC
mgnify:CR=1 FL=1